MIPDSEQRLAKAVDDLEDAMVRVLPLGLGSLTRVLTFH